MTFIRCLLLIIFFSSAATWAQTCTNIFPNGLQAHGVNGNVKLSYHSVISNGTANIASKTITDNTAWLACSGSSCVSTGVPSITSTPTFLTSNGSNGAISIGYQGTGNYGAGQYSTVSVGQQATLNFTTAAGSYRTQAFTTNYQSIVNLQSGDYWINGNLTIAQETQLRRVAASGTTRIFVNGNVTFGFKASTQNFSSDQLLIYATGNITADNEVNLKAYVYAGGTVSLDYRTSIEGAVAGSSINLTGNEVSINYTGSNLVSADFSPFCSGGYVAPVLLGAWNMDEPVWNGTANEVLDSSGNNNHGRARIAAGSTSLPTTSSGNPAYSSGNQSTCYYGEFDKTTAPARTYSYVELTGLPALPQGFTFAAWIRSSNASAQHQRILVRDDAQNGWGFSLSDGTGQPKLRFFNRNVTNNGAVTGQGSNPNCGVFCVDTNAVISSNAWHYVAAVVDTSAKTVTLYVYDQSRTLLAKTTAAYSGTWQDGTGLATIGGESSASSEGRQTSWHFLGNIDEVKIYSGAVTQTTLENLMQTVRTCAGPDHYELQISPLSIACEATAVTVRACANSMVPCTKDLSINSSVTLATSAGSLLNTSLTLSSGEGTTYLRYPTAANGANSTVTLSNEQIAAINSRKCCTGTSNCSVANSCATLFNQAGFVFSNSASTNIDIASQVAASPGTAYVKALTTDQTTKACVARFTSPQAVQLGYKCRNPIDCIAGQTFSVASSSIQSNSNSVASNAIAYTNVNLNFDNNGVATLPIEYSDVGQLRLFARLALSATGVEPAFTLLGESNDFVVRPYSLSLSNIQSLSGGANPGTTSSGTGFVAAGEKFRVTLNSLNAKGNLTPNFGNETTNSQISNLDLTANSLLYPSGGNLDPLVNGGVFTATATPGQFLNSDIQWNQVGSITLMPKLISNDYLGAGNPLMIVTGTVGRFYPDHFTLTSNSLSNACTTFTYMQHNNMPTLYTLEARNKLDVKTINYNTNYASGNKPIISYVAENANAANGASLSSRVVENSVKTWVAGVMQVNTTSLFSRNATPDGPYDQLRIGLQLTDNFDLRDLVGKNMNATTTGNCSGTNCSAVELTTTPLNMRFGRLKLDNAFGPETADLPVNFATEYWTGGFWQNNSLDYCTTIDRTAITYPAGNLVTDANRTVSLGSGSTQGRYQTLLTNHVLFSAGNAGQYFTAPGNTTGSFVIGVDLTTYPWLRFDWNQNNDHNDDAQLPNASIGFGSYRGHDRIIYWREVF